MSNAEHDDDVPMAHDESNWLVSYADMMTLLFGFFVLMYTMSRVDREKYEVISKEVALVFGGKIKNAMPSGKQIEIDKLKKVLISDGLVETITNITKAKNNIVTKEEINPDLDKDFNIEQVEADTVLLKLKEGVLFAPGSDQLSPASESMLTGIAKEFKNFTTLQEIHIEGHTDDSPISTDRFRSNWELSGARSSRIARLISEIGVKNPQIIAEGYGSSVPILPNRDEKGLPISKNQNVNRRVVFKLKFSTVEPPKIVKTKLAKYGPDFVNAKPQNSALPEPEVKAPLNPDMEARFNEAQARLEAAQKKLKEVEEQKKKNQKIEEMERKIQQIENRAKDLSERAQKAVDEKK